MNIFQIFVIIDADKFQLVFTEIKNGMALQKILLPCPEPQSDDVERAWTAMNLNFPGNFTWFCRFERQQRLHEWPVLSVAEL